MSGLEEPATANAEPTSTHEATTTVTNTVPIPRT